VTFPSVELRDLDNDGVAEVAVTYKVSPGRSEATWLFRWAGSTLVSLWDPSPANVSPTTFPALQVHDFVDLDGDDQIEVVTREVEHDGSESDDPDLPRGAAATADARPAWPRPCSLFFVPDVRPGARAAFLGEELS
jgi:hypothetical protein